MLSLQLLFYYNYYPCAQLNTDNHTMILSIIFQYKLHVTKHTSKYESTDIPVTSIDSVNVRRPKCVPRVKLQLYCPASDSAATK